MSHTHKRKSRCEESQGSDTDRETGKCKRKCEPSQFLVSVPDVSVSVSLATSVTIGPGQTQFLNPWTTRAAVFGGGYNTGQFNLATGVFTAPLTGKYSLKFTSRSTTANPAFFNMFAVYLLNGSLLVNGSAYAFGGTSAGATVGVVGFTQDIFLLAGRTISFVVFNAGSSAITVLGTDRSSVPTQLSISLLSVSCPPPSTSSAAAEAPLLSEPEKTAYVQKLRQEHLGALVPWIQNPEQNRDTKVPLIRNPKQNHKDIKKQHKTPPKKKQ